MGVFNVIRLNKTISHSRTVKPETVTILSRNACSVCHTCVLIAENEIKCAVLSDFLLNYSQSLDGTIFASITIHEHCTSRSFSS